MEISGCPRIADLDYSSSRAMLSYRDSFDKDYLDEPYIASPDQDFPTKIFCRQPYPSIEMQPGYPPEYQAKSQEDFNPTLQAIATNGTANPQHIFNLPPFGQAEQYEQYPFGFSFDPTTLQTSNPSYFSPTTDTSSRTPSLCGDGPQQSYSPTFSTLTHTQQPQPQQHAYSPTISPRIIKEESPCSPTSLSSESTPKKSRKRGRPRLDHGGSGRGSSSTGSQTPSSSTKSNRPTTRLPHNQVERKYREGLNSELERLRKAVPTLPQSEDGAVIGQPKPSKAMVLSSAIEYIRRVERERDEARGEVERLRREMLLQGEGSGVGGGGGGGGDGGGAGSGGGGNLHVTMNTWTGGDAAFSDFLQDL